ncbi:kelch repeat and BTB domain-containing protein 8-like isoform 1-T1 [Mantella aurantiaca]
MDPGPSSATMEQREEHPEHTEAVQDCIIAGLQEMYFSETLCNVTILAADKSFLCHRIVLASVSPYFKALFTSPMKESVVGEVDLLDIPSSVMRTILHYIYMGEAPLTFDNAEEVFIVSSRLQVTAMINLCSSCLSQRINNENCLWIYRLAHSHNHRILMDAVIRHISKNLSSLSGKEDFFHLEMEELVNILSSDDLMVSSELAVYDLARCWWEFRTQKDNPLPPELLKAIRIPLLNPEELERISMDIPNDDPPPQHPTRIRLRQGMFEERIICMVMAALKQTDFEQELYHMNSYDPTTDSWEKLPFCSNLVQSGIISVGCCLYVSGGFRRLHSFSNELYMYDSVLNKWKELPPMKYPRAGHGFQAYKNKLYAFGGYNTKLVDSVECFSMLDNSWHNVSSMPLALHNFTNTVHKGKLFAFGGIAQIGIHRLHCQHHQGYQIYDTLTDTWSQFLLPILFSGAGCVVMDDKLYIIVTYEARYGGPDEQPDIFSESYCIDHLGRICDSAIPPVVKSISGSAVIQWQHRIYIVGGSGYTYRCHYKMFHWSPGETSWTLCKKELPFIFDAGSVTLLVPLEKISSIIPGRRSNYNFRRYSENETGSEVDPM